MSQASDEEKFESLMNDWAVELPISQELPHRVCESVLWTAGVSKFENIPWGEEWEISILVLIYLIEKVVKHLSGMRGQRKNLGSLWGFNSCNYN